jgi:acid phosphatase family membrane protein YuiD
MSGLWQNEILLTSLLAWAIAQGLKVPLTLLTSHKWDFNRLVSPGGMPSSHSALVTALATSVGRVRGLEAPETAIAIVLAFSSYV